jgi:hypothetical protein
MTGYLRQYNVVIDPEQGQQRPDGSWAQEVTLVLLVGPGTRGRRPVAVTFAAEQARALGFELPAAQRTTADRDDAR